MSADDDKGTETVLKVLAEKELGLVDFKMGAIHVKPSLYEKVAKAIAKKEITVLIDAAPLTASESGLYVSDYSIDKDNEWHNVLFLRSSEVAGSTNEQFHTLQAIVHECTHAGLDLLKVEKMVHYQHEAAAYVAQSIYTVAKMLNKGGSPAKVTLKQPIETAAWAIGTEIVQGNAVSTKLWNTLNDAIKNSDEYKNTAKDAARNLGVGRHWKINGKIQ